MQQSIPACRILTPAKHRLVPQRTKHFDSLFNQSDSSWISITDLPRREDHQTSAFSPMPEETIFYTMPTCNGNITLNNYYVINVMNDERAQVQCNIGIVFNWVPAQISLSAIFSGFQRVWEQLRRRWMSCCDGTATVNYWHFWQMTRLELFHQHLIQHTR